MTGLLQEKNEMEKLRQEYKKLAQAGFETQNEPSVAITEPELALEECQ